MPAQALHNWEVDAGLDTFLHALGRTSKDTTGAQSSVGTTFFNLDFQVHGNITDDFWLSPRIMWMPSFLLPHQDSGSPVKTSYFIFALPVTYVLTPSVEVDGGLAWMSYNITGPGGTTQLDNGNGTSTFALPGDSASGRTIALIMGGSYHLWDFKFSVDLLTEGLLSSTKRTYSLMGAVTYAVF